MKNILLPPTSHQPKKYAGPSADEVLALRRQFMNPGLFLYYKKPMMLVEGKGQYVFDDKGRRYLDGWAASSPSASATAIRTWSRRRGGRTNVAAFHHDLSAPQRRRIRRKARLQNAGQFEGLLLRQLRLGSDRSGPAHGARLHRQFRHHRPAQLLSRRQHVLDGADRAQHLEIQRAAQFRRASRHRAGPVSRPMGRAEPEAGRITRRCQKFD
jgi:hypothetical protein